MNTKKYIITSLLVVMTSWSFGETVEPVVCDTNSDFKKNSCDVCFDGGNANISSTEITLIEEQNFVWKNTSEEASQLFYQDGQKVRELISSFGTPKSTWKWQNMNWAEDIEWSETDGQKTFTLDIDKSILPIAIKKDTKIPLEKYNASGTGNLVFKIPVTYYEINNETFARSDAKTTNYCVSYTPKITANEVGNTDSENTDSEEEADETTIEDTVDNVLSEAVENTEDDPADTVPEVIEDEGTEEDIPSYDANVSLNSAGTDPSLRSATNVETGPEEIFILFAACLLGILLYPKVNQIFQKN